MPKIRDNSNTGPGTGTLCKAPRSPSRCFPVQQQVPGRHHATARKTWPKEVNIVVMECYSRSNPIDDNGVSLKGYRQRMYRKWLEYGAFGDAIEQRICDQARAIKKWMVDVNRARDDKEKNQHNGTTEDSFPDSDELVDTAELSISINEVSEEEIVIVSEMKEICD